MGELAELLGLERTTVTGSAAALERNGWVSPLPLGRRRQGTSAAPHPYRTLKLERAFPKDAPELDLFVPHSAGVLTC
jgi:hypothetical protein